MNPVQIAPDSPKLAVVMVGLPARGKSYTARSAELALLDEIAASCDVAVTGFGV